MTEPAHIDLDPDQIDMFPDLPARTDVALSTDARRTVRQRRLLQQGIHPLSMVSGTTIRLHPDAPTTDDNAPGPRCGDCRFRQSFLSHSRAYPKCTRSSSLMSHSATSDCRKWWGACQFFEPREEQQ